MKLPLLAALLLLTNFALSAQPSLDPPISGSLAVIKHSGNGYNFVTVDGAQLKKHWPLALPTAGPGLDYSSWSGILLFSKKGSIAAARVGYFDKGHFVTGQEFYNNVNHIGPRAPDGAYAQVTGGPVAITWARDGKTRMLGRITVASDKTPVIVESYPFFEFPATYQLQSNGSVAGQLTPVEIHPGTQAINGGLAWIKDRSLAPASQQGTDSYALLTICRRNDGSLINSEQSLADLRQKDPDLVRVFEEFKQAHPKSVPQLFMMNQADVLLLDASINSPRENKMDLALHLAAIEDAGAKYASSRLSGSGSLGAAAAPMADSLFWNLAYHPFLQRNWITLGRPWVNPKEWNFWGWDENFAGMIAANFDEQVSLSDLTACLGDERVGTYCVWRAYLRHPNREFLKIAYSVYSKVYPATDAELVKGGGGNGNVGKGMDDTPMREFHGGRWKSKYEMYSVDMSSMKAWSLEILGRMARELGDEATAQKYDQAYKSLCEKINQTLWNEERGIYLNRYLSGAWPKVESPTSFYPMLAGVPSSAQAKRLEQYMRDPDNYWGEYVIPTLHKQTPEYGKTSPVLHNKQYFVPFAYWRGCIWGPPNYMVYEGLKRCHLDQTAAEFAEKSVKLWLKNWNEHQWACENYNPLTGGRGGVSHVHYNWSMLLPLTGLQELIDIEPWGAPDAIRFGTLSTQANSIMNVSIHGHRYDVVCADQETILRQDGRTIFQAQGAPVVVRDFLQSPQQNQTSFTINASDKSQITLYPPRVTRPLTFAIPKGESFVTINKDQATVK
jgi:hypothetical protein